MATKFGAGLGTEGTAADAAAAAARQAGASLAGAVPDLAFAFLSPAYLEEAGAVAEAVTRELAPRHLLGCVAEGVIGGQREVETGPGVSVWAASLPGATVETFHATAVGRIVAGFPERPE